MLRSTASLLFVLFSVATSATHMSGGEIYWECLGNDQYRIRLIVYRDCAGINVDPSYNLELTSPCGDRNLTVSTNGGTELSQLCDLELPNSTCSGGTMPGIEQYVYTGTITLPPCDSWQISWTNIYRNNAIVNLTNPGTRHMYIESVLNSADAPCNDSPTFTNTAIPYVCLGYPVAYSYGAVDAEGDSLSYSLIGARMINGSAIPYVNPYTPTQPIPGLTLDPVTGLMTFTLSTAGNWVVAVLVTEYDANGNVIGSIMRDMQFVAYPCSNIPPDAATGLVSNLTGQAIVTGPRAVQVCESGDLCFDMVISDANATNVLEAFSNAAQSLPGAVFTYTGSNPITAHLCWTAQPGTAGFYPLIVNVNDGACPIPAFQTYVYSIEVLSGLAATVNVVDESCQGSGSGSAEAVVTAGTGPYGYAWSNGSSEAMIVAGAGTYNVTITDANGCQSDLLVATIDPGPAPGVANAGTDIVSCPGTGPVDLNGSVTNAGGGAWSGGNGTIGGSWPNNTYIPSAGEYAAGAVDLVLTTTGNGGCPPDTDTVRIALPNSFVGLSIDHTDATCAGASTGTAAVIPTNNALGYLWNDPAAQTTAQASNLAAGSYTVIVTDGSGCDTTMSVSISQPAAITVSSIAPVVESCAGVGDGTLTAQATGGTAPYTYSWNTGATGPQLTAASGTYTVSVTDANGCTPATANGIISAAALPNLANAGNDLIGCMGNYPIPVIGTVTNAPSGQWSGGTGTILGTGPQVQYHPSTAEILAGGVDLVLTTTGNTNCPPATDTVHITLSNSFLSTSLVASSATCQGSSTGSLSFVPASTAFQYLWNDPQGQTTAIATGLNAGAYTVLVTDTLGCDTAFTGTITEPQALVVQQVSVTDVSCNAGSTGSIGLSVQGGTPGYTVLWSNGQSGANIGNLIAGTYSATVQDAQGCTTTATAVVAQPAPMVVSVTAPDTVCVNATNTYSAIVTGGAGGYVYNWGGYGYNQTVQLAFAQSQTILLTVVDQDGCAGPNTPVSVNVLDLASADFETYGDTTTCIGGVATVGATLTGYAGGVSVAWSQMGYTGFGPYTVPISSDQTISVTLTDVCGSSLVRQIGLQLDIAPAFELPAIIEQGCAPLTVQYPTLGLGNVLYTWDLGNGQTSNQAAPQVIYPAGSFTASLTVTTPLGCTASSNGGGQIVAYAPPAASFTASTYITDIDAPTVEFTNGSTGAIVSNSWTFGDGGTSSVTHPTYAFNEIGTFDVELAIVDQHGCESTFTRPVTITPVYDVVLPTAFTPNPNGPGGNGGTGGGNWATGDLSNDVFYPFVRFVDDFRMRIFNRWGELIFESTDLQHGWDGYYRGQISPQDVYVVQTWFRFVDGKTVEKLSDLTLFR